MIIDFPFRMTSCHAHFRGGGHPRYFLERNLALFEEDLRKWIASLASSEWMPICLVEDLVQQKTICYPLEKVLVKKSGNYNDVIFSNEPKP